MLTPMQCIALCLQGGERFVVGIDHDTQGSWQYTGPASVLLVSICLLELSVDRCGGRNNLPGFAISE